MPTRDFRTDRFRGLGLLFLRLGAGLYLAVGHGWPKIAGSVGEEGGIATAAEALGPGLPALLLALVSGALELFGGLLTIIGVFTRPVSGSLLLYVTGAYLIGLGVGGIGPTLVYVGVFLTLLLAGPGRYSVDEYMTDPGSPEDDIVNSKDMPAEES